MAADEAPPFTPFGPGGPLPAAYAATREALHLVAVHIVARARSAATGRFGLRVTPGGFGTPAFGDDVRVVRVTAGGAVPSAFLVVETAGPGGAATRSAALDGATLAHLATFAGVDLAAELSVGRDTPPLGDPDRPLTVDGASVAAMAAWWAGASAVLDVVVAALGPGAAPSVQQLWPEHFDVGLDVGVGEAGARVNLGASPGDTDVAEPYLYVGPWGPERPGDPAYWNAGFGAVATRTDIVGDGRQAARASGTAAAFFERGVGAF